jgi:hypothetical protein
MFSYVLSHLAKHIFESLIKVIAQKIILKLIFENWEVGNGLDRRGYGQRQMVGSCKCGNEPSGSIKCGELLE